MSGPLAVLFAASSLVLAQDAAPLPREGKSSVSGQVTSATTKEPLRKAWLRLLSNRSVVQAQSTDGEGRFRFTGLPAGTYKLEAERQGYVSSESSVFVPTQRALEITVAQDQDLSDVAVRLWPHGSISVRVVDNDGDPWVHASISLLRATWRKGRFELASEQSESVNAAGESRMTGLKPGRYFVLASPDQQWEQANRPDAANRVQPTWFPGVLDQDVATPIVLRAGDNREGLQIRLQSSRAYRIKGKLAGWEGIANEAKPQDRPILSVVRVDSTARSYNNGSSRLSPDLTFDVEGLRPGRYEISAIQRNSGQLLGKTSVELQQADIDDVTVELVPPFTLKGRAFFDEAATDVAGIRIWLQSASGDSSIVSTASGESFEFPNLAAGKYYVHLAGVPPLPYVKRIRIGETESTDGTIEIDEGGLLEVELSARGASIIGTIGPNDQTSSESREVWLIPDTSDPALQEFNAQSGVFDQRGIFRIRNIRPGSYRLYAWQNLPEDAWKNSEFLARMESKGVAIKLEQGQTVQLVLPLISPSETASLLAELGMVP